MEEKLSQNDVRFLCVFAVALCCLALGFPIGMVGAAGLVVGAVLLSAATIVLQELGGLEGLCRTTPFWSMSFIMAPTWGFIAIVLTWLWGFGWRDWTWMSGLGATVAYILTQRAASYSIARAEQQIPPPPTQTASTAAKQ